MEAFAATPPTLHQRRWLGFMAACVFLGGLSMAWAGDAREDAESGMSGLRPALAERGVTLTASYIGEVLGNVSGGRRSGAIYDALLEVDASIDAGKLLGWKGGSARVSAIYPHGESLSTRYVGDLGAVSAVDAYDSLRLYEAWAQQNFFEDRFSLRVGFLAADAEFAVMDTTAPFIHSAFGTPIALTNNFAMSTYPYSALGARLRIELWPGCSVMLGAFDGNVAPGVFPDPSPGAAASNEFNHWGTHFALRAHEGAMLFGELGWQRGAPVTSGKDEPRQPFFAYKIGATYHTDEFSEIGDVTRHRAKPRGMDGNFAVYGSAERELWHERGTQDDGLRAFARATFAPADRNVFQNSVEAGVVYAGLCQEEARDHLALGMAWYQISDRITEAQRRIGQPVQDYEAVVEVTYQYRLNSWCTLQPDLQWVIHPGGSSVLENALVLGARVTLAF